MTKLFNVIINNGTATISVYYKTSKKLKLQVKVGNQITYHDITDRLIIPLTFGNGNYRFTLYQQTTGTKYAFKAAITKAVKLKDPKAYTLAPNSYVYYNEESSFYTKAKELQTWNNIWHYLIKNFQYDYITALMSGKKPFSTPDLEQCYARKKGICYDLSALGVAMARICGIPASLAVGSADNINHAWIIINDKTYDIVKELKHTNKSYKYTLDRVY